MHSTTPKVRKLKFWTHLVLAYLTRYRKFIAGFVILSVVVVYGITKLLAAITNSNTVSIGYVGNYTIESVPAEVLSLATDPLITTDRQGKPQPGLASHWTTSEDGKTYVVFLKDNLKWHDGNPVDAKDITIAIENVQITALNNKAIEFKLPAPLISFPTALDKPVFKSNTFYGTGQYRIVDINSVDGIIKRISLVPKNEDFPKVQIRFYQGEKQLALALKIGEVKFTTVANASEFEKWPNLTVEKTVDSGQIVTLFFNLEDPQLASKELRQGLIYAINKTSFDGEAAAGPISKDSWAYTTGTKRYGYNTGRAKELIAKSQAREKKIKISATTDLAAIAQSIGKDWQDLDFKVEIEKTAEIPEKFQVLVATTKLPKDPDQYALWHSTNKQTNLTKVNDARVDKLLEDARSTNDEEKRKELYADFARTLTELAPAAFLYHPYKYKVIYNNQRSLFEKLNLE